MQSLIASRANLCVGKANISDHPWRAHRLAIAVLALALVGACLDPNNPNKDPEVQRAFATMQTFADAILAEQAQTGRYPEDAEALFFDREWPGYTIERGQGQTPRVDYDDWVIVTPEQEPRRRIVVAYRTEPTEVGLYLLDYGWPACRWRSTNLQWACPLRG